MDRGHAGLMALDDEQTAKGFGRGDGITAKRQHREDGLAKDER